MIVCVFLKNKMINYQLPTDISGSYSFNCGIDDTNIINIEAREGKWVLYSSDSVQIIDGNQQSISSPIEHNKFYVLRSKNVDYLIYTYEPEPLGIYNYNKDLDLVINNDGKNNASLIYRCPYLNTTINLKAANGKLALIKKDNSIVYINKKAATANETIINVGDEIEIFGLRINILSINLLAINKLPGVIDINNLTSHLSEFELKELEMPADIKITDEKLYKKSDYYFKSPRLRRMIEDRSMKLSPAPAVGEAQEMPMILVIGPMMTMAATSAITLFTALDKVLKGESTFNQAMPQLLTTGVMLLSMLLWPMLTRRYNKSLQKKKKKETIKKYTEYLKRVEADIIQEENKQKVILQENLSTIDDCLNFMKTKSMNFWDKRLDQSDFLIARVGIGQEKLRLKIEYPEKGFTIEESDLEKMADELVESHKYLQKVPKGYSFYNNVLTAIMGKENKTVCFINNILLQLLTYYSYDDLKIVVLTTEENKERWDYLRYVNHNFNDNLTFRFFGTTQESVNNIAEYLDYELSVRLQQPEGALSKPHYLIVTDAYDMIKRTKFMKQFTEFNNPKLGFSMIIFENKLSKLPSKCNNFITLGDKKSDILINTYEEQEHTVFIDEINYDVNMYDVARTLSNIPIEFESGAKTLPEAINFLEMEKVGKVEQLNILNRWKMNDPISSLRAEVGVDENGDYMYLDLHEKYHGPHGLVAGMTGSGKSEFIITYILSMAINYSPDDVSFILIDYKGGGLAFAFENKQRGIVLPHLAGTITNLDKAEMDRTLVSINSEVKRRQAVFNEARDKLGESTIDIYKYQRFYKEGKLDEPVSHLFIICDEFAELKSQQPDFMDNLISVARIGRSLGVHLILATQKPSGVVNDQIWSNSKFKVCLKVQDASDSNEMLKKPDAANLKETGRFYLQVGYDEYFALGQSAWAGAKYYPSNDIVKKVSKSVDFIDDNARIIRSIEMSDEEQQAAQGEQLAAIMNNVIEIAETTGQKARRLWLDNIPQTILIETLENKYYPIVAPYYVEAVIGEYDAPEQQKQGLVKYNYLKDGSSIIYGVDGTEREKFLNTLIYSTAKDHTADEIEFYIADFGSESLRKFEKLPHVGGIVYADNDDKFNSLLKMIKEEITERKKMLADFGGDYQNYIKDSQEEKKLPIKAIIFNNYDSIYEAHQNLYDDLPELIRDSERYGIVYIFTANAINSIPNKISQNFNNKYTFKLNDSSDYNSIFDSREKLNLRNIDGRGLVKLDGIHEFQTASIVENENELNNAIAKLVETAQETNEHTAKKIPTLPDVVTYEDVKIDDLSFNKVPVGIEKNTLDIATVDYFANIGNVVASNKLPNTIGFIKSLIEVFNKIPNSLNMVIDAGNILNLDKQKYPNYYNDDIDKVIDTLMEHINGLIEKKEEIKGSVILYGVDKLLTKIDSMKLTDFIKKIKEYEKITIILVEGTSKLKKYAFEAWYTEVFVNTDGIWVGKGVSNQNVIQLTGVNKEMMQNFKNNMGYIIQENVGTLIKLIDFDNEGGKDDGK